MRKTLVDKQLQASKDLIALDFGYAIELRNQIYTHLQLRRRNFCERKHCPLLVDCMSPILCVKIHGSSRWSPYILVKPADRKAIDVNHVLS